VRKIHRQLDSIKLAQNVLLEYADPHLADALAVHNGLPAKMSD